ncbi:uncharacterized protein LOC130662274 [Hydractinia symbiolongicarpus]|uniref:uncharacterized protein LOC130662274 n=1 Tax=Hydractinia symbiolongicarpus TaxID=13093 RepID=UPI00254B390E|nr:uncharacterized protein LOC130662274 [Hydractinia symbiolongicarpus]
MDNNTEKLHLYLRSKNGMSLNALKKQFPNITDLETVLLNSPDLFWISIRDAKYKEVRAKLNIKLCYRYMSKTCKRKCGCVHVCKDFILSRKCCPTPCKNGLSHTVLNPHNFRLLSQYKCSMMETLLRSSFPRLCKSFQESGTCKQEFCGYLHLCQEFVFGLCSGACKLAAFSHIPLTELHNVQSYHNEKVFQMFSINAATKDHKTLFHNVLTGKDTSPVHKSNTKQVSPAQCTKKEENGPLLICSHYIKGNCRNKNCPRLHMCKEFLVDGSKCNLKDCKFGFSHSPLDAHNKKIMLKNGIQDKKSSELLKHLRGSFPRVCSYYREKAGCSKPQCPRMHVCLKFCIGKCANLNCTLSHNLKDKHNLTVLRRFSLHKIWNKNKSTERGFILSNILFSSRSHTYPRKKNWRCASTGNITGWNSTYLSTLSLSENLGLENGVIEESYWDLSEEEEGIELDEKESIDLEEEESVPMKDETPSQKDVFYYILENRLDGICSISDLCHYLHLDNEVSTLVWLQDYEHTFRIVTNSSNQQNVYLCLSEVRPCNKYWQMGVGCTNSNCQMFHVCQAYLTGKSHNMRTCKLNHNLKDPREKKLMQQLEWSVNEDQLLLLLKMRYPYVCSYYTKENCEYGEELCPNLHVCVNFMEGNCKKQGLCRFKHDSAVSGKQAIRLMKEYQIDDDDFRTCVIIPDSREEDIKSDVTSLDVFNWLKEEGICRSFLVDKCSSESDCHLVHPPNKSPYLWQYKKKCNNEVWKNFPQDINLSIEKKYCDPSASQFINGKLHIIFSSGISPYGSYDGYNVTVRRLSTMSSVQTAAEEAFISTEWKWYWLGDLKQWEEYKCNVTSDVIEKKYLKLKKRYYFSTKQFRYKISFRSMTQKNLDERYKTKRVVLRRPVYKEAESIRSYSPKLYLSFRKKLAFSALYRTPSHWPDNFKPGQRIPLQDDAIHKKIEDSFILTMPTYEVISIEEICHSAHFAKFQIKKDEFSKRLTEINEMTLYHGTSHTVIDQICVQNFDWRVSGKNATCFGQGSYFSNNARYSHKYSTSDASGIFYMFVAEVLVGQYAKGDSSMKRPPNLPNSDVELYDSCVNDVNNPNIFVIYERDQCYPRYLISYKQRLRYRTSILEEEL